MVRHRQRVFQRTGVLQVGGNVGRAESVIADPGLIAVWIREVDLRGGLRASWDEVASFAGRCQERRRGNLCREAALDVVTVDPLVAAERRVRADIRKMLSNF